jgi:hypothetical protein
VIVSGAVPAVGATAGVAEGSVRSGEEAKKGGGSSKHQTSGKKELLCLGEHHCIVIIPKCGKTVKRITFSFASYPEH